jgi:hypothetical protein
MNVTQETMELIKAAMKDPNSELAKAWAQSGSAISGITAYDLEAPAKKLYPVITPLRNKIPRVSGRGGIQANWRAVTGINTGGMSPGVSEGNRSGAITTTTADYLAAYKGLGLEDYVNFEAEYAAQGFDDVKALAVEGLLRSLMIAEEKVILGGQGTWALAQVTGLATTPSNSGGTCTAAHSPYSVQCVALTLEGYLKASVVLGIPHADTRSNMDGTTESYNGGSSRKSSAVTATIASGSSGSIAATVTAVKGAVAYAWFWGASGADVLLGAITTINSVVITTDVATGTQNITALADSDHSANSLLFDGLIAQICKSASGGYYVAQATGTAGTGTPLTADTVGGITEIDVALKSFWDNYRLSPSTIWVNAQEQKNISVKILTGSSTGAQRFTFDVTQGLLAGGTMVRSYLNKYSMDGAKEIPIKLHPNFPPGTILFDTDAIPYPLSNVSNVLQMKMRREYYQIEWPVTKRRWEYGVYMDGVLQNYFPPAFGVISNIGNG